MADLGYGVDTWAGDSLVTGRLSRGPQHVLLALYRRLITPRGTLRGLDDDNLNEDELNYGFDVAQYCGASGPELAVKIAPGQIRAELMKDDRVADCAVSGSYTYASDGTAVLLFNVAVVLQNAGDTFTFTVKIANMQASLLNGGAS